MTAEKSNQKISQPAKANKPWKGRVAAFVAGQNILLMGSMLMEYAVIWHITITTQSGGLIALATISGFLPQAIMALFAGVWADRWNRKWLVMISDGTLGLVALGLFIGGLMGLDNIPVLLVAMAIRGLCSGIQAPAAQSIIPQISPKKQLMRISGINSTLQSILMLASPAIAGAIYAAFGQMTEIFALNVATATIGVTLLAFIKIPHLRNRQAEKGYFSDIAQGFKYMWGHKLIRSVFAFFVAFSLLVVPMIYLAPLMITRIFGDVAMHIGPFEIGQMARLSLNEMSFGVGMGIGGGLVAAVATHKFMRRKVLVMAATCMTFGVLGIVAALIANAYWPYLAVIIAIGVAVAFDNAASTTLFQTYVTPAMQGRMFSLVTIVWSLSIPLGMAILGPVSDTVPIPAIIVCTGILTFILGLALRMSHTPKYELAEIAKIEKEL